MNIVGPYIKIYIASVTINLLKGGTNLGSIGIEPERTSYEVSINPFIITKRSMIRAISKTFYLFVASDICTYSDWFFSSK